MNPRQFEILITPIKGLNPDQASPIIQKTKEEQPQIRRKSCECSECGKNNRTIQRLYLMDSQPPIKKQNSEAPQAVVEVEPQSQKGNLNEQQGSSNEIQIKKFRKTKSGIYRNDQKMISMKSQRKLQYDLATPRSLIKTQSCGYRRLTINLKKFGPSLYEFKEQQNGLMVQSQSQQSSGCQEPSKSERQLVQESKQSTFSQANKIDKLFKIKVGNKTLQNFLKQKQKDHGDKENHNPAKVLTRKDSLQMMDKQFYLAQKDKLSAQTQKTTLTDTLPSPKGFNNFSIYLLNDVSPIMRERRSGSHHFFNRKQTLQKNQTKQY